MQLEAVLAELQLISVSDGVSPDASRLLSGLAGFLARIDAAYVQSDRDLDLKTRSLQLSLIESRHANNRIRTELDRRNRVIDSLRETVNSLMQSIDADLTPLMDNNLESLTRRLMPDRCSSAKRARKTCRQRWQIWPIKSLRWIITSLSASPM